MYVHDLISVCEVDMYMYVHDLISVCEVDMYMYVHDLITLTKGSVLVMLDMKGVHDAIALVTWFIEEVSVKLT